MTTHWSGSLRTVPALAAWLEGLLAREKGTFLAVESSPRLATWRCFLPAVDPSVFLQFSPAWFDQFTADQGLVALLPTRWLQLGGLVAGGEDADFILEQPGRLDLSIRLQRVRTIDTATVGLKRCSVLSLSGKDESVSLLAGAHDFIRRLRPVVLLDVGQVDLSEFPSLPPGYEQFSDFGDSRLERSYVVAIPHERLECSHSFRRVRGSSSVRIDRLSAPTCSRGLKQETIEGRTCWIFGEKGFGVLLDGAMVETHLSLIFDKLPQHGFRVFVNGERASSTFNRNGEVRIELAKWRPLIHLEVRPIRWSTVEKIPTIALLEICL